MLYRETHILLDELADAVAGGSRKEYMESIATAPLLIIDDFGMRKLPHTAAEDLLEIIMRRYERFSTLLTSNRPVEDWGKLLGDVAAVSAMLDRLLHHGHVLKCGPRSWRTKSAHRIIRKNIHSLCEGAALARRFCWATGNLAQKVGAIPPQFVYRLHEDAKIVTNQSCTEPHSSEPLAVFDLTDAPNLAFIIEKVLSTLERLTGVPQELTTVELE